MRSPLPAPVARRALALARRRLRWLVRPPAVRGKVGPMLPGASRMGRAEEEAAAEAAREVIRAKRLYRHQRPPGHPFDRSRVVRLEEAFAARIGVEHALGVNSGTSALVCALTALGIGPGDEVVVPAYTWFSTASAVLAVGAVPVVAEVDESLTLDPADVERRLSPHTRAILPVHMRGAPADMDGLLELARRRGLRVLEDVAQAPGGSFRGRALGSLGDAGAFSFQMAKVMTAGEGGMVTTRDAELHRRAAMYHDSAWPVGAGVSAAEWLPGLNLRMPELTAAVLLVQLERLDGLLAAMRAHKAALKGRLAERASARGVRFRTIHDPEGDVGLALVLLLPEAERAGPLVAALLDENVPASRLYHDLEDVPHDYVDMHAHPAWIPLLERRTWSARGGPWRDHPRPVEYSPGDCPVTVDLLRRAVHVDVGPDLTPSQVEQMGDAIAAAIERLV